MLIASELKRKQARDKNKKYLECGTVEVYAASSELKQKTRPSHNTFPFSSVSVCLFLQQHLIISD